MAMRMSSVELSFLRRAVNAPSVALDREALLLATQRLIVEVDALAVELVRKSAICEQLERERNEARDERDRLRVGCMAAELHLTTMKGSPSEPVLDAIRGALKVTRDA